MKKFALAAVIVAFAISPAAAAKKKAKRVAAAAPVTSTANNNENSARFARDSLPVFLPSWSIPLYLQAKGGQ